MIVQQIECGINKSRGNFTQAWKGWLLLAAVFGALCLSPVTADATMIQVVTATSIETTFDPDDNGEATLTMAQSGVHLVYVMTDGSQGGFADVDFELKTTLDTDTSVDGQAGGIFTGGTITIKRPSETLLIADIGEVIITEGIMLIFNPPTMSFEALPILSGAGGFEYVSGSLFQGDGAIFDLTWAMDIGVSDFSTYFTAQSNITLTPEPGTIGLLTIGGLALLVRRKRRHGV